VALPRFQPGISVHTERKGEQKYVVKGGEKKPYMRTAPFLIPRFSTLTRDFITNRHEIWRNEDVYGRMSIDELRAGIKEADRKGRLARSSRSAEEQEYKRYKMEEEIMHKKGYKPVPIYYAEPAKFKRNNPEVEIDIQNPHASNQDAALHYAMKERDVYGKNVAVVEDTAGKGDRRYHVVELPGGS